MKQILPILTLTTLSAAAFADAGAAAPAAAASGLSYNRVGISYVTNGASHPYSLEATSFIGSSNVLVGASATLDANGDNYVYIGYVFKNAFASADVTVAATTNDSYGINIRRALGEVVAGLEVSLGYQRSMGSVKNEAMTYEVAYNINKQYSIAYGIQDPKSGASENSVTVRYNF